MEHLTNKPVRINGRKAGTYVAQGIPFTNSNNQLYARWETPHLYVVYSYGAHWPLFIYCVDTQRWYANEDKASRTTSRHYSCAFPHTRHPVMARSCTWMKEAARKGLAFILLSQCDGEQQAA